MPPEITWGDTVKIVESAPAEFHPGCFGAVCGFWPLSATSGEQLMFTLEFGDGETLEIPKSFLAKIKDGSE